MAIPRVEASLPQPQIRNFSINTTQIERNEEPYPGPLETLAHGIRRFVPRLRLIR